MGFSEFASFGEQCDKQTWAGTQDIRNARAKLPASNRNHHGIVEIIDKGKGLDKALR